MIESSNLHVATIGQRLDLALRRFKMGTRELADKSGWSRSAIQETKNGINSSPRIQFLIDLAQTIGINPIWLAFGKGMMVPNPESRFEAPASSAYFILHRGDHAYTEVGVSQNSLMFLRQTEMGEVTHHIPLGPCTPENINQLQKRLNDVFTFFNT